MRRISARTHAPCSCRWPKSVTTAAMGRGRIRRRPAWDLGPRRPGERLKPTPVFHAAMTEKRLLALVALLIGLVAGLLILVDAVNAIQLSSLGSMLGQLVGVVLGVAILLASLLIYRSKYSSGGVLAILPGVVALVLHLDSPGAIPG